MKRLGILLACAAVVALPSAAQLSGSWEMRLSLLPATSLDKATLTLSYGVAGWMVSSVSTFTSAGYSEQEFRLAGSLAIFRISGAMTFNPSDPGPVVVSFPAGCVPQTASYTLTPPEYMWAWVKPEFTLLGVTLSAMFEHWAYPYTPRYEWDDPNIREYEWPCCEPADPATAVYMRYTLVASVAPIAFTGRFEDCYTGIMFKDFSITLTDVSLCCGITSDAELYFTKAGFQHVKFVGENLPGFFGFSIDVGVTFTVTGKAVEVTPKWQGWGEICVQVYGNVLFDDHVWSGIVLYGYRIACTLAECNTIEFITAMDVIEVEKIIGDVFQGDEYQVIKLGVCGPGCCGGKYYVNVDVYFSTSGSLFGLSRAEVRMDIPLLANLIFTSSFSLPVAGSPSLSIGGVFNF